MKVVWSNRFLRNYSGDPAAAAGRLEPVVEILQGWAEWVEPEAASREQLRRCHGSAHLEWVARERVAEIAALAAGGAVTAARLAREEPAFALVRPPGHHASRDRAWGFCYCNNLAVALHDLRAADPELRALVLDFDLHFGDGTVDILGDEPWVEIVNPGAPSREDYLVQVINALEAFEGSCIGLSAGFDNHELDWGGLLETRDYELIGLRAGGRARKLGAACFGVLEGGYNHAVLGENVHAFLHGLERGWQHEPPRRSDRNPAW